MGRQVPSHRVWVVLGFEEGVRGSRALVICGTMLGSRCNSGYHNNFCLSGRRVKMKQRWLISQNEAVWSFLCVAQSSSVSGFRLMVE